jgi:hypothetical protein
MACACKVNEEINKIQKYYSYNEKDRKEKPRMEIDKKAAAQTMLIYLLLTPFLPIMFIYVLFFSIFSKDKKISMKKIFNFIHNTRNGRKEQII